MVFEPPTEFIATVFRGHSCSAEGGFLLAIPDSFLSNDVVLDAVMSEPQGIFGPSKEFLVPLLEEDENGDESYV